MRGKGIGIALSSLLVLGLAAPSAAQELPPKLRTLVQELKGDAESKNQVNRTQQGNFYFKWLQQAPEKWDKAYFKMGELSKGVRFLSLQLIRKTQQGVEMLVLNDQQFDLLVEEAYKGAGKSISDADKNIQYNTAKAKVPLTPEMSAWFSEMVEELKWELRQK